MIYAIFFWQLVNKTAKISSKKVWEKLENNSMLEKVLLECNLNAELLQLVGATFDSKVACLRRMGKKNLIILKRLFVVVDIWVVKYQLKVFGKL